MVSAKLIFKIGLTLLFIAVLGVVLIILGIEFGKYFVYLSVPLGAILIISGAVAANFGLIEKDI